MARPTFASLACIASVPVNPPLLQTVLFVHLFRKDVLPVLIFKKVTIELYVSTAETETHLNKTWRRGEKSRVLITEILNQYLHRKKVTVTSQHPGKGRRLIYLGDDNCRLIYPGDDICRFIYLGDDICP